MNDLQLANWLLADGVAWISVFVPALIALGVLVFVVAACIRHGHRRGHETSAAAACERQRSVRPPGVVFFPR